MVILKKRKALDVALLMQTVKMAGNSPPFLYTHHEYAEARAAQLPRVRLSVTLLHIQPAKGEAMADALHFSMMGEDDSVFEVTIERAPDNSANLRATCTCGSARHGEFCAHRFEILEGDISNLASDNMDDVTTLRAWIVGSDIEDAMRELSKAKTDLKIARERYAHCRNVLVRRMMD